MRHRLIPIWLVVGVVTFVIGQQILTAQPSTIPQAWRITAEASSNDATMLFRVVFSEPVTGVDVNDFVVLSETHTAIITQVTPHLPTEYLVTITLSAPIDSLHLALIDDDSIINAHGIPLGGIGTNNGNAISTTPLSTNIASRPRIDTPMAGGVDIGSNSSIALTSADIPVISYYDATNGDLKLAVCNALVCNNPIIRTIDTTDYVGSPSSIALTSTNAPVISYYDRTNYDLKLAICDTLACLIPTIRTIDTTGNVGNYAAVALTSNDIPIISYYDMTNTSLKLAVCDTLSCASPITHVIEETGNTGLYLSMALTSDNRPIISYIHSESTTINNVKLAICGNPHCTSSTVHTLATTQYDGFRTDVAVTADDIPIVAYLQAVTSASPGSYTVRTVLCADVTCTSNTIRNMHSNTGSPIGQYMALAITTSSVPFVSYYDSGNDKLLLATCTTATCESTTYSSFDSPGPYSEIVTTSAGVPVISYYDKNIDALKIHVGNQIIDLGQPNTFGKSSPANNSGQSATTATLTWNSVSNATGYEYCISTSATSCTSWTSTGSATTATVSGLSYATYYWQVRAANGAGTTLANNNTPWRFTVTLAPAAFAKTAPANNAKNQKTSVALSWAASTRATSYEYCIATSTAACTNWKSVGTKRTVTVTGLTKNKTYFWQVRAKNAGGTTLSSSTFWKFTTAR